MWEKKLDAFLVSDFHNIFYLTGFKTLSPDEREAFVLVTHTDVYLFSDGRYLDSEKQTVEGVTEKIFTPNMGLLKHLEKVIKREKIKKIGFEEEDLKFIEYQRLAKKLKKIKLVPALKLIQKLREIKDEDEVVKIRKACRVADQCLKEIIKTVRVGQAEKEIAFKIEFWLKEKGYDVSFDPIVAVDENAAIPHYDTKSGAGVVEKNSILLIDYGAKVDEYCSDTTRMFFVGESKPEVKRAYGVLLKAQEETVKKIKKGIALKKLDMSCREALLKEEFPSYPHSTGHGIGIEVHEAPSVFFRSKNKAQTGQIFTIEPGIYIQGLFGMRIEDTVLMTEKAGEILTKFPKELRIL